MTRADVEIGPNEERLILLFWAYGADIRKTFSPEKLEAVSGLKEAVNAVSILPDAIGWGDEPAPKPRLRRRKGVP